MRHGLFATFHQQYRRKFIVLEQTPNPFHFPFVVYASKIDGQYIVWMLLRNLDVDIGVILPTITNKNKS